LGKLGASTDDAGVVVADSVSSADVVCTVDVGVADVAGAIVAVVSSVTVEGEAGVNDGTEDGAEPVATSELAGLGGG
jgi:hypothetical protein